MSGPVIRTSRRALFRGLAGLTFGAGLTGWLRSGVSRAAGDTGPRRLMLLHRPNGTIRPSWLVGDGATATFGSILEPFEDLRSHMLVPDGLVVNPVDNAGINSHEGPLTTMMTLAALGPPRPPSNDDYRNTANSIDLRLAESSPLLNVAPIRNAQLAAHNRQEGSPEVANMTLTYSGADAPVFPVTQPSLAYAAIVGELAPGQTPEELQRLRAKRRSVLDFLKDDLGRLRSTAPASAGELFDAHESSIRALEDNLDLAACKSSGEAPLDPPDTDWFEDVQVVGEAQLDIVRTAFACDLTRVVSYMWSTGGSRISFNELYPGMGTVHHHGRSHDDLNATEVAAALAAIDRWYSERTAAFLRSLRDTVDIDGNSVLDNTLVVYFSEVAAGNHAFGPMPVVLFGGAGIGLQTDQILDFAGRSIADLWLAVAERFGGDLGPVEVENQGPLPELFA